MKLSQFSVVLLTASTLVLSAPALSKGGQGKSNAGGNGKGKSSNSSLVSSNSSQGKQEVENWGNNRGSIRSKLGALNAANASAVARLNAAPNSRVGLIAEYERAVLLGADYEQADADLLLLEQLDTYPSGQQQKILESLQQEYASDNEEISAQELEELILSTQQETEVASQEQALTELQLLELAANKTVSPEVAEEVNRLLGIELEELAEPTEPTEPSE